MPFPKSSDGVNGFHIVPHSGGHRGTKCGKTPYTAGQSKIRNLLSNGTSASSQVSASDEQNSLILEHDSRKQPRPLKPDGWWKEADDFLATDAWGPSGPTVRLHRTNEQMRLCAFQCRSVTLIMLTPAKSLDGLSLLKGWLLAKVNILFQGQVIERVWVVENILIFFYENYDSCRSLTNYW